MEIRQTATVEVQVNGEEAKRGMQELEKYATSLKGRLADAYKAGDTKKIKQLEKELRETNGQLKVMRTNARNIDEAMRNLSVAGPKELRNLIKDINSKLNSGHIKRGSAEWKKYQEQLKLVNAELRKVGAESKESEGWLTRFNNGFTKWGALAASGIAAVTGLTFTIRKATDAYAEMEEAESQVVKYTGMTKEQVRELNEDLKRMDTRTARDRLNALAGDAGRLGKSSKKDVLEFIDAADKINVALGEDLGEDAVKNIGKLAMMFGEDKEKGLRGAMLATGSAVNAVGQTSSAAEAYLVDFTARVAGAANQAKISQANIIGFASVLDQNMLRDETAATAFQNIMIKMYQEPAKFAKLAGQDVTKFTNLLKTDANEAILQFLQSLKQRGSLDQLAPLFDKMKLDGQGAASVLSVLAGKIDNIRVAQKTANAAYDEGTSIIDEFNVQNNTVQAGIDKARKKFADLTIELGEKLLPIARYGISTGSLTAKILSSLIDFLGRYGKAIVYAALVLGTYIAVQKLQYLWTNKVKIAIIEYNVVQKLKEFWDKAVAASTWLYIAATSVLTGKLRQARLAMQAFSLVLKVNNLASIATLVIAVSGALFLFSKRLSEAEKAQKASNDITLEANKSISEERIKLDSLKKILNDSKKSYGARKWALEEIQKIVPEYHASLTKEGELINNNSEALDGYIEKLLITAKQQAANTKLQEALSNRSEWFSKQDTNEAMTFKTIEWDISDPLNGGKSVEEIAASNGVSPTAYRAWSAKKAQLDKEVKLYESMMAGYTEELAKVNEKYQSQNPIEEKKCPKCGNYPCTCKVKDQSENEKQKKLNAALKNVEANAAKEEALIKSKYAKGDLAYRQYCKQINDNDIKELDNKMALYAKESNEYNQLLSKKQDLLKKGVEQENKFSLEEIEACAKKEEMMWVDSYHNRKIDRYALNEALFMLDIATLSDKQALYEKNSKEWQDYEKQIIDLEDKEKLRKQQEYQQMLSSIREEYSKKNLDQLMQDEIDGINYLHKNGLLEEEKYQKLLLAIKRKYLKEKIGQVDEPDKEKKDTSFWDAMFGDDIQKLRDKYTEIENAEKRGSITHQEALQQKGEADAVYLENLKAKTEAVYSALGGIMSAYSNYANACQDLEVAKIEKKYDTEIKAAGNNTTKTKKLEEKKEQEVAKVKSKYNQKAMKIEIAQAFASMAMSAINAYSSAAQVPLIGYILAPIAAAAAVAAGMMNIATIKKQHQAQELGYYSGGFTPLGDPKKEVGVVHASEFVANHSAVNNPNVLPVLQLIDNAQKNNTVGSLTADDISMSLGRRFVSSQSAVGTSGTDDRTEMVLALVSGSMSKSAEVIENLTARLDAGIESYVTIDGERGFERQYNRYKKLKTNKSR